MLSVRQLGVGIAGKSLITGLSFSLKAGDMMAIVGPSGSGKTTLLRTLVGLIDATEGEVRLHGQTPDELGWPQFRRRMMWVAQRPLMFAGTVRDNLAAPFAYASAEGDMDEDAAERLLSEIGMPGVLDQEGRTLSEGQAQRLCLVRALLLQPDVLLLDEPTSALDEGSRTTVEALLARAGKAVLLVSHDRDQVDRLASDRIDLKDYAS